MALWGLWKRRLLQMQVANTCLCNIVLVTAVFAAVTALQARAQDDDPLKPYQSSYTPATGAYEVSPGHIVVVVIAAGGSPQYIDLQRRPLRQAITNTLGRTNRQD